MISLRSFAVAVQEFLPDEFVEQTFSTIINQSSKVTQGIGDNSVLFEESAAATASISLPGNILMSVPPNISARITNAVYLNDDLFLRRESNVNFTKVGSLVISAGVVGNVTVQGLFPPIEIMFVRSPVSQSHAHSKEHTCTVFINVVSRILRMEGNHCVHSGILVRMVNHSPVLTYLQYTVTVGIFLCFNYTHTQTAMVTGLQEDVLW